MKRKCQLKVDVPHYTLIQKMGRKPMKGLLDLNNTKSAKHGNILIFSCKIYEH